MSDLCNTLEKHHLMPLSVAVNTACLEQLLEDKITENNARLEQLLEDKLKAAGNYELCEFYYFRSPTLKPGFQPAQGGLLVNAATIYPAAWEYLQTAEGQQLCKSEAEWQAMTKATWATLADGTKVGWDGIGGAPFYAPDYATGTLRLPDLRGMYTEAAGFDSLEVGGVHGDAMRNIAGDAKGYPTNNGFSFPFDNKTLSGVFFGSGSNGRSVSSPGAQGFSTFGFNVSRVVPTANKVQGRAWGALTCVYLGVSR